MKLTGLALGLGLAVIGLGAVPASAQGSRAVETCAKAALQQAMLLMSVEGQSTLHDKRGLVVGTKVDMRVNALGKKKVVSCFFHERHAGGGDPPLWAGQRQCRSGEQFREPCGVAP